MSVKIADRLQRVRSYGERLVPLGPGVVWCYNPDLNSGLLFPLQKLFYRGKLSGPTGQIEASLTFVNPTQQPQDAYFLFPLDRNIAPVKLTGQCGSQEMMMLQVCPTPDELTPEHREKIPEPLAKIFREETERVLAISLGTVAPGDEVNFRILYACFVSETGEEGLGFSFRLPMMLSKALQTLKEEECDQTLLSPGLERGAQVGIQLWLEAADLQPGRISTSQACGIARSNEGILTIQYDNRSPLEPRDFVLDYQLWSGNQPKAWLRSQGRHFVLNFLPPVTQPPPLARRIVFLVDGSEEMKRVGTRRCHDCIAHILKGLGPQDRFALVAFNRDVGGFMNGDFVEPTQAAEALKWFTEYNFGGVADLKALLGRVVTLPRQADSILSVIILAAGKLGNEPDLYRILQGARDALRLFPVVLGRQADPFFARAASRLTGGRSFSALTEESISRVADRLSEETRQPILGVVGLQDRGLGFQGDSITPKYPSGLSAYRPINILGVHSGQGGVEAGGKAPNGGSWSEQVEQTAVFHQVLPAVWALVKATELDDESRMLDRAERVIMSNVVRSLSEEYSLTNDHTVGVLRFESQQPRYLAPFEPWLWFDAVAVVEVKAASELLQEQAEAKGIEGGRSEAASRGLTMKETMGRKGTATVIGSKIGHRSKLTGGVKEGLFSKPMLRRVGGGGDLSNAFSKPMLPRREYRGQPTQPRQAPQPPQRPPVPEEQPTTQLGPGAVNGGANVPETPTQPLGPAQPPQPPVQPVQPQPPQPVQPPGPVNPPQPVQPQPVEEVAAPSGELKPAGPVSFKRTGGRPSFAGGATEEPPQVQTPQPQPQLAAPATLDPTNQDRLPTPQELAAQLSPQGRGGDAAQIAKNALRANPDQRQSLMNEMRLLHNAASTIDDPRMLGQLTEAVLRRLSGVAVQSELLVKAYGLGYQAKVMIDQDINEAKQKLKFWLGRFAKLF